MHLYAFYLGGKAIGQNGIAANIEVHDVVFAVGKSVKDCYKQCRQNWFGRTAGLHIDAYVKLKYVEGYEIKPTLETVDNISDGNKPSLYFVYLGGSVRNQLIEGHGSLFMITESLEDLKNRAKSQQPGLRKLHIDDIYEIVNVNGYNIQLIESDSSYKLDPIPCYIKL